MSNALEYLWYYRKNGYGPIISRVRPISFFEDGNHSRTFHVRRETTASHWFIEYMCEATWDGWCTNLQKFGRDVVYASSFIWWQATQEFAHFISSDLWGGKCRFHLRHEVAQVMKWAVARVRNTAGQFGTYVDEKCVEYVGYGTLFAYRSAIYFQTGNTSVPCYG